MDADNCSRNVTGVSGKRAKSAAGLIAARMKFALFCLSLLVALPGRAQNPDVQDVQKVITQLNTAATKFVSAQANFSWDQFTAVVSEDEIQTGTIYFERKKGANTRMAAYLKQQNGKDVPKTITYDGGEVQYYEPIIKQMTILKAGANKGQWESFLTLGFGGSGDLLEKNWKVTVQGNETMSGVSVVKLDLVPVDPKVLDLFTHVTIWVDPTRGVSYKQVFYQPSGDTRTALYKDIQYNTPIAGDVFKIKPAPGTTTQVK
jgi:outer membrane lipoprotein-sorting protein